MGRLRILIPSILVVSTMPMVSMVGCNDKKPEPIGYHTIHFENVVDPIPDQSVKDGELAVRPEDPKKTDYSFTGWYTDQQAETNLFDWDTPITHDYTLYAGWLYTGLTFTVTSDCAFQVLHDKSKGAEWPTPNLEYSINGADWEEYTMPEDEEWTSIPLETNDVIKFRGDNPGGFSYTDGVGYSAYILNFDCDNNDCGYISGNIMSLISKEGFESIDEIPCRGCFMDLFKGDCISDASNLVLPADQLSRYCYLSMFDNCSFLTQVPDLPATELEEGCYQWMFRSCKRLEVAQEELVADTLADQCYKGMFSGCTSLIKAPKLSVATVVLPYFCYRDMFSGCSSLEIKELSEKIEDEGYIFTCPLKGETYPVTNMFNWCRGFSGTPNEYYSYYWV